MSKVLFEEVNLSTCAIQTPSSSDAQNEKGARSENRAGAVPGGTMLGLERCDLRGGPLGRRVEEDGAGVHVAAHSDGELLTR